MPYSKLDCGIVRSSIWSAPLHIRVLWITILALKDEFGFVATSRPGLIREANITPEQFDDAIKILESPDDDSRSNNFEGRRVDRVEGGWIVLNHDKYRLPEQEKKKKTNDYMREYMRNRRDKERVNINKTLTSVNSMLTPVSVFESVSESSSVSGIKDGGAGEGKPKRKPPEPFQPPTLQEFTNYCEEHGYKGIADRAYKGYAAADWKDSQGKQIKSWKQKLQHVWFREDNKAKEQTYTPPHMVGRIV
jgi:hypothetical protein